MNFLKNIFKRKQRGAFFNASDHEMKNLLCGIGKSDIRANEIYISEYPFEPSVAYPNRIIRASEIGFIGTEFGICRLYVDNDIIFVTSEKKEELLKFAKDHKIEPIKHSWNWDWILEPYLDTECTAENEKRTENLLIEVGIDKNETQELRKEVSNQMFKYNFDTMLWDWCSLGLHDVLSAMRVKYDVIEFRDFYKKAIEIDKRVKTR